MMQEILTENWLPTLYTSKNLRRAQFGCLFGSVGCSLTITTKLTITSNENMIALKAMYHEKCLFVLYNKAIITQ